MSSRLAPIRHRTDPQELVQQRQQGVDRGLALYADALACGVVLAEEGTKALLCCGDYVPLARGPLPQDKPSVPRG